MPGGSGGKPIPAGGVAGTCEIRIAWGCLWWVVHGFSYLFTWQRGRKWTALVDGYSGAGNGCLWVWFSVVSMWFLPFLSRSLSNRILYVLSD
ncbi:hypothetical protein BDV24DRAFT_74279 [Aspergillus arachidicola]|uniref:Uncharacterized protein n=1 Tax=Aspergillus arachidicola TaxID=656916 RepID=A0A5N6Y2U3_9EURO|nr:hypothetical protein BDV24DRAFT_74279 [Aspergillus arachidicola]